MGDIAKVVGGGTPKAADKTNFTDAGGYPWLTPADLSGFQDKYVQRGRRNLSEKGYKSCGATLMPKGAVLLSSRAPIGYLAIAENEICTNQGFKSFVCTDAVLPEYVFYWLKKIAPQLQEMGSGTTFMEISGSKAKEIPISIAPIKQQEEIVQLLDQALPRMRSAKERIENARMMLKRFRQAVLIAAYSGKMTADWRKKQAVSTDDWTPKKLDSIFTIRTGGTPSRKNIKYYKNGTISWVKTGEVQNCDIYETEEKITEIATKESNAKLFPAGTLLIAMYGEGKTRGQIGWLRIPAATNQACAALINEKMTDTTKQFTFYFLLSQYEKLRAMAVGGNQPNLNLGIIKSWAMPLPSDEEQSEVVRLLHIYFEIADQIEKRLNVIEESCERISSSILYSAFSAND